MAETISPTTKQSLSNHPGHVLRVSGTIIDVQFPRNNAPNILNELKVVLTPEKPQGKQEIARRKRQIEKGVLKP